MQEMRLHGAGEHRPVPPGPSAQALRGWGFLGMLRSPEHSQQLLNP